MTQRTSAPAERCAEISGLTMALGIDEVTVDRADPGGDPGGWLAVRVRWSASGSALSLLGGSWRVSAWSAGSGSEVQVADEVAPVVATSAPSISQAVTLLVPVRAVRSDRRNDRLRVEIAHHNQGRPSSLRCDATCDLRGLVA
jgi:hypothetical protein